MPESRAGSRACRLDQRGGALAIAIAGNRDDPAAALEAGRSWG